MKTKERSRTDHEKIIGKIGNQILIRFYYNVELISKIKEINGRDYDGETKRWSVPLGVENTKTLIDLGFKMRPQLKMWYEEQLKPIKKKKLSEIEGLKGTLYPFQREGVEFIEAVKGRVLLADEMGLGKTVQVLAWLQLHPEIRPALIICPASLKLNWEKEVKKWMSTNANVSVVNGGKEFIMNQIVITNYDVIVKHRASMVGVEPRAIIFDEVHYIKNDKAKRTKAAKNIAMDIPHVLCLSGTPIVNRPIEIYNAISLIKPSLFPNRWQFAKKYCNLVHTRFGWDMTGSSNTKKLNEILTKNIMIRRLKANVLTELPNKTRASVPLQMTNAVEYQRAENDFIAWVKEKYGSAKAERAKGSETLVQIGMLKQLALKGKMKEAKRWISDFLGNEEKLVVFTVHRIAVEELREEFKDVCVVLDGSTPMNKRQQVVEDFQNNDKVRLFIGNIKAAGVGITLTASSNVAFLELPWTPGELTQAEDRVHRIGQKSEAVNIWYLSTKGTIEENIIMLLNKKQKILDQVLDGKDVGESSVLNDLVQDYLK